MVQGLKVDKLHNGVNGSLLNRLNKKSIKIISFQNFCVSLILYPKRDSYTGKMFKEDIFLNRLKLLLQSLNDTKGIIQNISSHKK